MKAADSRERQAVEDAQKALENFNRVCTSAASRGGEFANSVRDKAKFDAWLKFRDQMDEEGLKAIVQDNGAFYGTTAGGGSNIPLDQQWP